MKSKIQKKREYLSFFVSALKNWDYLVQDSWGFYANKVNLVTHKGTKIFTKKELEEHITLIKKSKKETI